MPEYQQEMLAAFLNAPIGIVLTQHRVIKVCNTQFAQLFGYEKEELTGQSFRQFYPTRKEFEQIKDIGVAQLMQGEPYTDERLMCKKDGSLIWCRMRASTLAPNDPLSAAILSYSALDITPSAVSLTPRERQVIKSLHHGQTSKQIGRELGISPRTVDDVRARLLKKFEVSNTIELLQKFSSA